MKQKKIKNHKNGKEKYANDIKIFTIMEISYYFVFKYHAYYSIVHYCCYYFKNILLHIFIKVLKTGCNKYRSSV